MHEGVADYLTACLVWLQSGGKRDLNELASQLAVTKIADLTMARVYPKPPPPARPPPPSPKPRPPPPPPRPRSPPPIPRPRPRPPAPSPAAKRPPPPRPLPRYGLARGQLCRIQFVLPCAPPGQRLASCVALRAKRHPPCSILQASSKECLRIGIEMRNLHLRGVSNRNVCYTVPSLWNPSDDGG